MILMLVLDSAIRPSILVNNVEKFVSFGSLATIL